MSDDLVKRLRDLGDHAPFEPHMHHTAADRIEELEAKLAKALEGLEDICGNGNAAGRNPQLMSDKARITLAELTGGKDE